MIEPSVQPGDGVGSQAEAVELVLSWRRQDLEARLGLKAGRYTDTGMVLPLVIGLFVGTLSYVGFFAVRETLLGAVFLQRGSIPYWITLFTCWSLGILYVKYHKLKLQRQALRLPIIPPARDFILAPRTAPLVLRRIYGMVDNPQHFMVLNRIETALSNLKNIGHIADVSQILVTQAANDEDRMVSSYSLIKGFIWGAPVLGFIGTVLGLSQAIGGFGGVLTKSQDVSDITTALKDVTAGLSVAFDTTLVGLVAALTLQLMLTMLMKREEDFLHECSEFCSVQIVGRMRLLDTNPPPTPGPAAEGH
jgi:hypothetical protein